MGVYTCTEEAAVDAFWFWFEEVFLLYEIGGWWNKEVGVGCTGEYKGCWEVVVGDFLCKGFSQTCVLMLLTYKSVMYWKCEN